MSGVSKKFVSTVKKTFIEETARYFDPSLVTPRLTILLVEDDEPDAYLISRALASNPRVARVVVAEDGVRALELIDSGSVRPDLAIVDLHMPRKDGFALVKDFAAEERRQFPSVILTSSASRADAYRATDCGAVQFITKPDTTEKLAAALDSMVYSIL
jgi:CheY-like chemotaxis protein